MIKDSEKSVWRLREYSFWFFTCTALYPTTLRYWFCCEESKVTASKYLHFMVFLYTSRKREKNYIDFIIYFQHHCATVRAN